MPRGGARVNSGPPPDPTALRRERPSDKDGWTTLPAARKGRTPKWPLLPDVTLTASRTFLQDRIEGLDGELGEAEMEQDRDLVRSLRKDLDAARLELYTLEARIEQQDAVERQLWRDAWKSPQATAWERLAWHRDVAQYVRHKTLGEMGSIRDAQEARQWSDRLGLNPAAMLRLRWKVAADEVQQRRADRLSAAPAPAPAARNGDMRSRIGVVQDGGQ